MDAVSNVSPIVVRNRDASSGDANGSISAAIDSADEGRRSGCLCSALSTTAQNAGAVSGDRETGRAAVASLDRAGKLKVRIRREQRKSQPRERKASDHGRASRVRIGVVRCEHTGKVRAMPGVDDKPHITVLDADEWQLQAPMRQRRNEINRGSHARKFGERRAGPLPAGICYPDFARFERGDEARVELDTTDSHIAVQRGSGKIFSDWRPQEIQRDESGKDNRNGTRQQSRSAFKHASSNPVS